MTKDTLIWNLTNNKIFTSKSAYHHLIKLEQQHTSPIRRQENITWIWKMKCHPCEQFFIRQTLAKGLPTTATLH